MGHKVGLHADMKLMTIALAVAMSPFMGVRELTPFGAIATPESQGKLQVAIPLQKGGGYGTLSRVGIKGI